LLPAEWRAVNAYGIKLNWRTYDCDELGPLRLQPSGVRERNDLWEVRHAPYDVSRIHVRGPGGWITAFWKHLNRVPVPFGELAWDHARRGLGQGASEEEIADAVAALLRRAGKGPGQDGKPALSKRDRRVAARTKAAAPKEPHPAPPGPGSPPPEEDQAEAGEPLAKVIPMPIFDPFAEADKPW
jgi:putative transposase